MRGKRAKEFRRVSRLLSDVWLNHVALQQRDGRGGRVKPLIVPSTRLLPNGEPLPCLVRTGLEVRNEEGTGRQIYRRMKRHYKRLRRNP